MASPLPPLFIPEEGSDMLLHLSKKKALSQPWGSLKGMQFVIWNKICKSGMAFSMFLGGKLLSSCFL